MDIVICSHCKKEVGLEDMVINVIDASKSLSETLDMCLKCYHNEYILKL